MISSDDKNSASRISSPAPCTNDPPSEKVIIDPSKGGAVSPKAAKQSKALEVEPGCWIWDGVVKVLEVDLFSAAWEVRHGAAMALRELLRVQGKCGGMKGTSQVFFSYLNKSDPLLDGLAWTENEIAHEKWCNDLSAKFLCIFVLDRFGDFVSDQVSASTSILAFRSDELPGSGACPRDRVSNARLPPNPYASTLPSSCALCFVTNDSPGLQPFN